MLLVDEGLDSLGKDTELETQVFDGGSLKIAPVDPLLSEGGQATVDRILSVVPVLEELLLTFYLVDLILNIEVVHVVIELHVDVSTVLFVILNSLLNRITLVLASFVSIGSVKPAEHRLIILEELWFAIVVEALISLELDVILFVFLIVAILVAILGEGRIWVPRQSQTHSEFLGEDLGLSFPQLPRCVVSQVLHLVEIVLSDDVLRLQVQLLLVFSKNAARSGSICSLSAILVIVTIDHAIVVGVLPLVRLVLVVVLGKELLVLGKLKRVIASCAEKTGRSTGQHVLVEGRVLLESL